MELLHLPMVDSTSTHAAQLLAAGKEPPFIVWADAQTAGRGRRGSPWQSPTGNLFATVALPAAPAAGSSQGLLSLKAGVVVARLVQQFYGLRLTLKWPNDLLFGGAKLGGLLLESSISGGQLGDLLIGIGMNLAAAPQLPSPYEAVALQDILRQPCAAAAFVSFLAAKFRSAWEALALPDVPAAYTEYGVASGELWRHCETGELATLTAVAKDGALELQRLSSGEDLVLTSADHGWRWLRQYGDQAPLLVADIGNTAVKIAAFAAATDTVPVLLETWPTSGGEGELSISLERLRLLVPHAAWPLHIISVRPDATAVVSRCAAAAGFVPQLIRKRPVRCHGTGYVRSQLGGDRLAAIEGYLALAATDTLAAEAVLPGAAASAAAPVAVLPGAAASAAAAVAVLPGAAASAAAPVAVLPGAAASAAAPVAAHAAGTEAALPAAASSTAARVAAGAAEEFVLLVQAGTATTIDAVTTAGRHLGGLILPGLALALRSLHEATALLPMLTPDEITADIAVGALGHDTASAMHRAALAMTLGAIERTRTGVTAEHGLQPCGVGVYITGGSGALLAPLLGAVYVPALVLYGARAMVLGGLYQKRSPTR